MSRAEELLDSLTEEQIMMYGVDPVDEPHIVIESDKTITVPDDLRHIAVQGEHNIETVTFDAPRYWDGHDLSQMIMRIVYQRPDGHREPHLVENLRVDEADENTIHFEWTISGNVTAVKGNISFMVCAKLSDSEGNREREWHTRLSQDLVVDEGMECSGEEIVEQNPDIIEAILVQLDDLKNTGGVSDEQVANAVAVYLEENPIDPGNDQQTYVAQGTAPENTNALWIDTSDDSSDSNSGQNPTDLSTILETAPDNNLLDVSAVVTSFVDSAGAVVTGSFSNYIPMRMGRRYVTNMAPSEFHWFDSEKKHLNTKYYNDNPKELVPEQDGYLLIKLPADTSGSLVLEGTDIGAYRPEHKRLLPCPWAGKRCLVIADSNGQYVRPGFAELVTRDLEMVLHNISAGGQVIAGGMGKLDLMDDQFDLILVMLGTNDQGYNNLLGTIADTTGSYYANLKAMIEKLKTKFPTSVVVMMTMLKRTAVGTEASNNADGFWVNAQGLTTEDYRDAVIEVCGLYSIPCIDLYNTIDLRTEADRKLWALAIGDGTHPNALAHAVKIAPVVKAGILAHTPYVFPEWSDEEPDVPVEPEEPDEPVVPVTYTVTNNLTNVVTNNSAATVNAGTAYTARLSAAEGYAIDTVTVVMGGADITATAYADDIISIAAVTGNITITASATVAEEPDDGSPKLLHAWGTGVFDTALEDTVGNYDLTFWNEGHGIDGTAAMALQPGQSFTVRTKATRKTTLYRTQHYIMTNGTMGISAPMKAGTFRLGLESNPNSGWQPNAYVAFYYKLEDGADAVSDKIVGTKPVVQDDTVEIAMTWDAETSTVRVYQDGELIGETVTSVPLVFTGFRIMANYNSDDSAGSCPAEYVQIWRGVAEI